LLKEWTNLERKYGFENPKGAKAFYTGTSRPALIDWWSKNTKTIKPEPPEVMPDAKTFSAEWWVWWATINPEWRERDVLNGRLRASTDEPKDKERWDVMKRPGQCGMLTIVLCLFHWFNKLEEEGEEEETKDWGAALADVIWVV
ncbi:hypothetical protein K435DRAFT_634824, partial [Dendrothele bispora CBS 962.96]